jgi:hypothetical protein
MPWASPPLRTRIPKKPPYRHPEPPSRQGAIGERFDWGRTSRKKKEKAAEV